METDMIGTLRHELLDTIIIFASLPRLSCVATLSDGRLCGRQLSWTVGNLVMGEMYLESLCSVCATTYKASPVEVSPSVFSALHWRISTDRSKLDKKELGNGD